MTDEEKAEFMMKLITNKKKGGTISEWAKLGSSIVGSLVEGEDEEYSPIKTSSVIEIHTIGDQLIAETRNSYYYLIEEGTAFTFEAKLTLYQQRKAREGTHYE